MAYGIDRAAFNQGQNAKFGIQIEQEMSPTMVARGANAVAQPCYSMTVGCFQQTNCEKAATLAARDYKDAQLVCECSDADAEYIVRRLTPIECARLQGFPDWWCANLDTEKPTEEELAFWRNVFETHNAVMGGGAKAKTDKQIAKWLKHPHTDAEEYKMWGNGVALPCVYFVLSGIAWADALKEET